MIIKKPDAAFADKKIYILSPKIYLNYKLHTCSEYREENYIIGWVLRIFTINIVCDISSIVFQSEFLSEKKRNQIKMHIQIIVMVELSVDKQINITISCC